AYHSLRMIMSSIIHYSGGYRKAIGIHNQITSPLLAWAISPDAHRPSVITKDEIEARASEFGLHAANIERDYVFGWLLAGIYGASWLKDALVLKGGNCFRKAYFPHTRFSNDLDFSSTAAIQEVTFAAELNRIC